MKFRLTALGLLRNGLSTLLERDKEGLFGSVVKEPDSFQLDLHINNQLTFRLSEGVQSVSYLLRER